MKVLSIVGTRPNFLKEFVLNRALREKEVDEILLHTGQHYDYEMSQVFFEQLAIPKPDYHAEVPTGRAGTQTAAMLEFIEEVLMKEQPDVTLVYGDVTSTLAGALASAKLGIPVAHVEAGVRTEARFNSEEINRRVADVLSDILFANIKESYDNLLKENFSPEDVFLPGDVVKDMVAYAIEAFQLKVRRGDYHLLTIHRAENASVPERLAEIIEGLLACGERIVFPAHPRTRKALENSGMLKKLQSSNIELEPPLGYRDFMTCLAGANKVISDSGGVRREAYILGKPVISLIEFVWVPSMVEYGWEKVVGSSKQRIVDAIHNFEPSEVRPAIFGDGTASQRIVEILLQRR